MASTQLAGNVITSKFIQNEKKKYITIIWDVKRQIIDMGSEKQNSSDTTAVIQEKLKKAKSTPPLFFFNNFYFIFIFLNINAFPNLFSIMFIKKKTLPPKIVR